MAYLDDDWVEIKELNTVGKVKGISQFGNKAWKQDCEQMLNN